MGQRYQALYMETQVCFVLLAKTYKAQQYGESIVAFPMTELPVDVEICLSKIQGNATLFFYGNVG